MVKVNNKHARTMLMAYFTPCSSVSIVNFGKVNDDWNICFWNNVYQNNCVSNFNPLKTNIPIIRKPVIYLLYKISQVVSICPEYWSLIIYADLKIFFSVRLHIKIITWKFRIFNSKNSLVTYRKVCKMFVDKHTETIEYVKK